MDESLKKSDETVKSIIFEHLKKHRYAYILAAAAFFLMILPLCAVSMPKGHDIYFHMNRIELLANEIQNGNFFPYIYSAEFNGIGYGAGLFYGDLILYPGALAVLCGVNLVTAYKLTIMMIFSLCIFSSYICAKKILKDDRGAFTAAMIYGFSGYFAIDLLERAAVGEGAAFIFLPVALLGLFSVIDGDGKYFFCLPVGLALLLGCHVLTAVVFAIFCFVYALVRIKVLIANPKKIGKCALAALVFGLLSAAFIFPMTEQLAFDKFLATGASTSRYGTLASRALPWWALLSDFNLVLASEAAGGVWIPNGLGMTFVLLTVFYIFFTGRKYFDKEESRASSRFYLLALLFLYLTSNLFPWKLFQNICGALQFPWRLLAFAVLLSGIFGGLFIAKTKKIEQKRIFCLLLVGTSLFSFITVVSPKIIRYFNYKIKDTAVEYEYKYNVGAGEYLPELEEDPSSLYTYKLYNRTRRITASDNVEIENCVFGDGKADFEFKNADENAYADVPILMYKGYAAYATDENGVKTKLEVSPAEDNLNFVRVHFGDVESGKVSVYYEGTAVQKITFVISALTVIALVAYIIYRKIRNASKKKKGFADNSENPFENASI